MSQQPAPLWPDRRIFEFSQYLKQSWARVTVRQTRSYDKSEVFSLKFATTGGQAIGTIDLPRDKAVEMARGILAAHEEAQLTDL